MINQKVVKIHPDLDAIRKMFNLRISEQLETNFPKCKSDMLLANSIRQHGLLNFKIIKTDKRSNRFDILWQQ